MPSNDDDLDEWDDQPRPDDDKEIAELTADIGTILAGTTVLPAAFLWWRSRRERRAAKEAGSIPGQARTPPWYSV